MFTARNGNGAAYARPATASKHVNCKEREAGAELPPRASPPRP